MTVMTLDDSIFEFRQFHTEVFRLLSSLFVADKC